MVNKTSTHQICFNILNNYDIFGHNLLSIKKKKLASKFEYFPDFSIHVELFILRRKVQSKKRLQPCSLLNVCPQQEDFENRIKFTFYIRFWEVSPYKCVSMGDLNCSVTVYFWLCCYGGILVLTKPIPLSQPLLNTCISGRIFFSNDKLKILMFNNIRHYLQGQMFLLFAFTIVNTPIILPTFFNWRIISTVYILKAF